MILKQLRFFYLISFGFCISSLQAQTLNFNQKSYTQTFELTAVRSINFVNGLGYVKLKNGSNYDFVLQDTKTLSFGIETSIFNNAPTNDAFYLYPNPVKDQLCFKSSSIEGLSYQVQIFSKEGEILYDSYFTNSGEVIQIDLTTLSKGLYIFKAVSSTKTETAKFIKQ